MKKYELTSETKVINGVEVHRIKSGREYERVVKYVESILKEENNNK